MFDPSATSRRPRKTCRRTSALEAEALARLEIGRSVAISMVPPAVVAVMAQHRLTPPRTCARLSRAACGHSERVARWSVRSAIRLALGKGPGVGTDGNGTCDEDELHFGHVWPDVSAFQCPHFRPRKPTDLRRKSCRQRLWPDLGWPLTGQKPSSDLGTARTRE